MRERMPDSTVPAPSASPQSEVLELRERVADLESRLAEAQHLLTIGRLAGGVAHDFNNLLTAILGYTSMLRSEPSATPQVLEAVDVIEKAADRASHLTSQLLGFARQSEPRRLAVDLHVTVLELVELLRHSIEKNIRIDTQLRATHAVVTGDPNQLFQVFLNLALNARDAMPGGGTLTFETEAEDDSVRVTVSDTGTGIKPEIRARIFDPFFTTKTPDKGSGLGLAVVENIVKAHGGRIELHTGRPAGTAFTVVLPREGAKDASRGKGLVLVVDDDEPVRQAIAGMVRRLGYSIIEAASGAEAVDHYRRRAGEIAAVLLDLEMPEMNGEQCLAALRASNPGVRVVATSGDRPRAEAAGACAVLAKPCRMHEIGDVLAAVLAR